MTKTNHFLVLYIELYPGISETQYSDSGSPNNRAEHILFTGAIGRAYTQMYTPIMPQKDILDLLGMRESSWSNNSISQSYNTNTKHNNADDGAISSQSLEEASTSTPDQTQAY